MPASNPPAPSSVGIFDTTGNRISRTHPLFVAPPGLLRLPFHADLITFTKTTGAQALGGVQAPEDFTSNAPDAVLGYDHTGLLTMTYNYTSTPNTGSYAGTPNANSCWYDFLIYGSVFGVVQADTSMSGGLGLTPVISCRIGPIAHTLGENAPMLPGYFTVDTQSYEKVLIAATDLPRRMHHIQLAFLSQQSTNPWWWLTGLLVEDNEINRRGAEASIWGNVAPTAITGTTSGTSVLVSPRTGTQASQARGFTRLALINTTASAAVFYIRVHRGSGQAETTWDNYTVQPGSTYQYDPPAGRIWTQSFDVYGSVSSGLFVRGELSPS